MAGIRIATGASCFSIMTLMASTALAQDASPAFENNVILERVIITGEKLNRDFKNTASSVSVITDKDIQQETGNGSVAAVIADIPNVVYTDTVSAPIIRGSDTQGPNNGQNVFWGGTVPRATINLDGHYLNYYENYFGTTGVWDVKNIEVFRGPQTTSQGANAIAGAIIVNTKDPTFTREGAYQEELGSYSLKRSSVALSGPIYKNELAARLAVDYMGRDTFIDYISPKFQGEGTDQDFRNLNTRLKLLWQPAEIPELQSKWTYSHTHSNSPSQEAASRPFHKLEHLTTTMPSWKQNSDTGVWDLSYEFNNDITFFNQAQYTSSTVHRRTGLVAGGEADITQKNVSNESRVTFGNEDDVLSGVTGIFYAHTKSNETLLLSGLTDFDDKKENLGIYGDTSYKLTDLWTLSGGLRYQRDNITRVGTSSMTRNPLDYDETFSSFLPKLSLAYAITPDVTVGALVSRGYNPGGVSLNLNTRKWMTFEEEKVWNYELFSRTSFLDDRITLNSNIFYMDFKNSQYNIPVVISPGVAQSYTINAEKAHSYGAEIGVDVEILYNLMLKTSAGLLQTKIEEIAANVAYEGNEFAKSPGFMGSAKLSWDATEKFNISGEVRYMDKYYSDVANTPSFVIDPYTIADLRMSYAFTQAFELYGYVKNVFDERSPIYMQQNRGIGGIEASMTMPRTIGAGIRGTF